jgi:hypothetical protein
LLSELQPVLSTSSILSKSAKNLDKVKSCNTPKSIADSQVTIDSAASNSHFVRSKKLTRIRSFGTSKSATDSRATANSGIRRKKLQKQLKLEPDMTGDLGLTTPIPVRPWCTVRKLFNFDWDPTSDDWKSREYARLYYLKKHRAKRFGLEGPEGGPFRPIFQVNNESQDLESTQTTPKQVVKVNSQRRRTISQSRHTPKTPTERKYTMIDINKYTKP